MKRRIEDALPLFVGLNEFFRRLRGAFVPVTVSPKTRECLVAAIDQIRGYPPDIVDAMKRGWKESAIVREVREYSCGTTMARLEVRRRPGLDLTQPFDDDVMMLMLALDVDMKLSRYTFVYGTGRLENGVRISLVTQSDGPVRDVMTSSWDELFEFINNMKADDYFIVADASHTHQYFQAYCDKTSSGFRFEVEYCLRCWSWQFALTRRVKRDRLQEIARAFRDGGVPGVQVSANWHQMYITDKHIETKGLSYSNMKE